MPRKVNQSLQNKVGQKIKIKIKTKDLKVRMESCPGEGVVKRRSFHAIENLLTVGISEGFGITEGAAKLQKEKKNHHRIHAEWQSRSGEVVHTLSWACSDWGLGEEVQAASSVPE